MLVYLAQADPHAKTDFSVLRWRDSLHCFKRATSFFGSADTGVVALCPLVLRERPRLAFTRKPRRAEQVWQHTRDRPLTDTARDVAAGSFGYPRARIGGEYLASPLSTAQSAADFSADLCAMGYRGCHSPRDGTALEVICHSFENVESLL